MRELLTAAADLGWAASLYGAERLLGRSGDARTQPADDLAEMARIVRGRLGPLARALCRAGEDWREVGFDGARLDVLAPGAVGVLARQEMRNRLAVYRRVVESRDLADGAALDAEADLPTVLTRAAQLETHHRLWAYEGLGYRLTADALALSATPRGLLQRTLPEVARPMLHAGMGLALAESAFADLGPTAGLRRFSQGLARFLTLCRDNAQPEQRVGAWDSLGFFVRHQRPEILGDVAAAIAARRPASAAERTLGGFFWHGVGRALYFLPICFLPGFVEGAQALGRVVREVPDGTPRQQARAGLAVAATLTNLRHPAVLEALVAHLDGDGDGDLGDDDASGFEEGVESALLMRRLMPDAVAVERLLEHRPAPPHAAHWARWIGAPAARALGVDDGDATMNRDDAIGPFLALNRRLVTELAS